MGDRLNMLKAIISSKRVKSLVILPILNVDISTTKYIILLKEKTISQVLHLRVSSWVITQTVFQVKYLK